MPIILARIDDRLIHGQVTEGWCSRMRPEFILVVSDEVSASDWHKDLCLASLPCTFDGDVVGIDAAADYINKLQDDPKPSYVLFESPEDVFIVVQKGARLPNVNVGGMHSTKGKREILDYIFVDDEDSRYLKALAENGIRVDVRALPDNERIDIISRL